MRLTQLLTPERVEIIGSGAVSSSKSELISLLATMLTRGLSVPAERVRTVLMERESLQSTGIGEGVAIPHGALPDLQEQSAAVLIVPEGVEFDAIDHQKVTLFFAVIGPKRASGEHLKTLARVSRLLRNKDFRERLIRADNQQAAYELFATEEAQQH